MLPAALVALALTPAADPSADLARVLAGWERRRTAVRTARYVVRAVVPPAAGLPARISFTGRWVVLFDFTTGRARCDQDMTYLIGPPKAQTSHRQRSTTRFDGEEWTHATRLDPNPASTFDDDPMMEVSIQRSASPRVLAGNLDPLLWVHGQFPGRPAGRFAVTGQEMIDGRSCVRLRDPADPADRGTTWVVDPGADGTVLRLTQDQQPFGKRPAVQYATQIEYRDTPFGRMPAAWSRTHTVDGQPPADEGRYVVESAEYNVPIVADEFRYTPPPGARVRTADGEQMIVRADGRLVPDLANQPTLRDRFWASRTGRFTSFLATIVWPLAGGLIVVAGLSAWLLWVRVRRAAQE